MLLVDLSDRVEMISLCSLDKWDMFLYGNVVHMFLLTHRHINPEFVDNDLLFHCFNLESQEVVVLHYDTQVNKVEVDVVGYRLVNTK